MDPFIAKSIRINSFWLQIMKEHAIFIEQGLPCERKDLIEQTRFFQHQYNTLLKKLWEMRHPAAEEIAMLNEQSIRLTFKFIDYKTSLLEYNITCQEPRQNLYAIFLDHIRREAKEFIDALQKAQKRIVEIPGFTIMREQVFWTRIISEHLSLIMHLLDPSERLLGKKTKDYKDLFDKLKQQSVDLKGMISPSYIIIPAIDRFIDDVTEATRKIRLFKDKLRYLTGECKVLGQIPELLADHVLRESEHFLLLLREHKLLAQTTTAYLHHS